MKEQVILQRMVCILYMYMNPTPYTMYIHECKLCVYMYLKHAGDTNRDADSNERHGRIFSTERLTETGDPVEPRSLGNRAAGGGRGERYAYENARSMITAVNTWPYVSRVRGVLQC